MQPRVTAILVARNGAEAARRTLDALRGSLRQPDEILTVDAGSADATGESLVADGVDHAIVVGRSTLGDAVSRALAATGVPASEADWIWILPAGSEPDARALGALLGAVEVAPSVAVTGPKLMQPGVPDTIARYGETLTATGASVLLVADELDQAQHDNLSDVLAVSAPGMLVRRSVWEQLRGFDHALPGIDAALDFCVRVRLAGSRVIVVPGARVTAPEDPELFPARRVAPRVRARLARRAQLHRRLVYAPAWAVPLHWLLLLPLALLRSLRHLIRKQPERVGGEFAAALRAMVSWVAVGRARRLLRRNRRMGWAAVQPLRLTGARLRERRSSGGVRGPARPAPETSPRPRFFPSGGWLVLLLAVVGLVAGAPLLGASALSGGAAAPLSGSVTELWSHVLYGPRAEGLGVSGAADPFAFVLAALGTLTFWAPSSSLVLLHLLAIPLAGLAAWHCAARFSARPWPAATAAVAWALAPMLTAALAEGRTGAVLAHVLLPWLALAALRAPRSWSAAGTAALLFAAVTASAPVLGPALLVAWVGLLISARGSSKLVLVPLPALALFAPLVVQQIARGTPLAALADPGVPLDPDASAPWLLPLGLPAGLPLGDLLPGASMALAVGAGLLLPLGVLALLAPLQRWRGVWALAVAALGLVSAAVASRLSLGVHADSAVGVWPGSPLSLYWLGLVLAAVSCLGTLPRFAASVSAVTAAALAVAAVPALLAPVTSAVPVQASTGRMLPAFVTAAAAEDPGIGTLDVAATGRSSLTVELHRGAGTTLDERSTLVPTLSEPTAPEVLLAELAGNLASPSGLSATDTMRSLGVHYVLLRPAAGAETSPLVRQAAVALDANPALVPIGDTAYGLLWRHAEADAATEAAEPADAARTAPGAGGAPAADALADPAEPSGDRGLAGGILAFQGGMLALAALLALPTGPRAERVRPEDDEAPDYDEDEDE